MTTTQSRTGTIIQFNASDVASMTLLNTKKQELQAGIGAGNVIAGSGAQGAPNAEPLAKLLNLQGFDRIAVTLQWDGRYQEVTMDANSPMVKAGNAKIGDILPFGYFKAVGLPDKPTEQVPMHNAFRVRLTAEFIAAKMLPSSTVKGEIARAENINNNQAFARLLND